MGFFDQIADWIRMNPGKTVGAGLGFIVGVLFFTLGWWKTIVIGILVLIGFLIGKSRDEDVSIVDQITGFFRRKRD